MRWVCHRKGNVDETDLHELKYLKLVIKETLRLNPSSTLFYCQENGVKNVKSMDMRYLLKPNSLVINAWAIGRNPEYWIDAEKFIPERFIDSPMDYKGTYFE